MPKFLLILILSLLFSMPTLPVWAEDECAPNHKKYWAMLSENLPFLLDADVGQVSTVFGPSNCLPADHVPRFTSLEYRLDTGTHVFFSAVNGYIHQISLSEFTPHYFRTDPEYLSRRYGRSTLLQTGTIDKSAIVPPIWTDLTSSIRSLLGSRLNENATLVRKLEAQDLKIRGAVRADQRRPDFMLSPTHSVSFRLRNGVIEDIAFKTSVIHESLFEVKPQVLDSRK